ncbi:hypothetical protein [Jiangella gansuensis]|uniref:hypothetical protein n=1 Tax=Jiangella gansuensis TaxID=281473 RepID=UPI00047E9CA8|nr:hypothetical protein [Jiangella gansuensis]
MTQPPKGPLKAKIRRVDDTLHRLVERRDECEDPVEVLRTSESIDRWLDERIVLMKNRDGDLELAGNGPSNG